jgi:hypothetical protein
MPSRIYICLFASLCAVVLSPAAFARDASSASIPPKESSGNTILLVSQLSPAGPLPQGFQAYRDPRGSGVVVYGTFSGNARSAKLALGTILPNFRGYFDSAPQVETAVGDASDQHVQSMFSASMRGTRVRGVAAVDLQQGGGAVSLIYDRPNSLAASFKKLQAVLARNVPERGADLPLHRVTLGDGSTISIPEGWRVTNSGKGTVELEGPNNEDIALGVWAPVYTRVQLLPGMPANYVLQAPCCDPVRAYTTLFPQIALGLTQKMGLPLQRLQRIVEAQHTPWANGQAAYLLSEFTSGGRPFLTYGLVAAMGSYSDPWTYYTSCVTAPSDVFRSELPMMLKVWLSYSINPAVFRERMDTAIRNMNESYKMMREAAAESTRASLSAAEGWDQVIRGVETVEHTGSGRRWEANNSAAQDLVNHLNTTGTGNWRIVPPSELIPKSTP